MINTESLEIDESNEIPRINRKVKRKQNPFPPYVKIKNKGKHKLSNKLRKKIKHLDKHHIDVAHALIHELELHKAPLTGSLSKIPSLCRNCKKCVRAVNYCSVFKMNCTTLNSSKCSLKTPL